MASRWGGVLLFGLLALSACSPPRVALTRGERSYAPNDYGVVLDAWTRKTQLTTLDEMDNVLTVTSTFESWDFRSAYVTRYAEDYRLNPEEQRNLLERSLAESDESHSFFVALYAQEYRWGDLSVAEPAWVIRLVDEAGTETAPESIQPIRRPSALERTYFPYVSPWRSVFRVTFPRATPDGRPTIAPGADWVGLQFTGAQGRTVLVWELEKAGG